ncbi:hypothetical protein BCR39DRAFT_525443 [Naematelia encephala]|uniref:Uncharacterized protein n=1 Tax=Naematelia encephala TaxID=71784 RepID=A0A1Y2BB76_9TREE|nr:hypothetical protein BCR39DRAFT_525443 [Naematelia encephala]
MSHQSHPHSSNTPLSSSGTPFTSGGQSTPSAGVGSSEGFASHSPGPAEHPAAPPYRGTIRAEISLIDEQSTDEPVEVTSLTQEAEEITLRDMRCSAAAMGGGTTPLELSGYFNRIEGLIQESGRRPQLLQECQDMNESFYTHLHAVVSNTPTREMAEKVFWTSTAHSILQMSAGGRLDKSVASQVEYIARNPGTTDQHLQVMNSIMWSRDRRLEAEQVQAFLTAAIASVVACSSPTGTSEDSDPAPPYTASIGAQQTSISAGNPSVTSSSVPPRRRRRNDTTFDDGLRGIFNNTNTLRRNTNSGLRRRSNNRNGPQAPSSAESQTTTSRAPVWESDETTVSGLRRSPDQGPPPTNSQLPDSGS